LREKQDILRAAEDASKMGAGRFSIVTSGNRLTNREVLQVAEVCKEIKDKIGIGVCASLGAISEQDLRMLKEAGISRYHHNIETSERFYPQIVSTHTFRNRVKTIATAKEIGLEVCSGGIIGMGENWQDRIDMALSLRELNVDSIPINILIPIKGTPLEKINPISCVDIVKSICLFRIVLKDKAVKIAAGRETILKDFQALGFMAGANGMLVGGYLTVKGREVADDFNLIKEIRKLWLE
jgi:biotin synthase